MDTYGLDPRNIQVLHEATDEEKFEGLAAAMSEHGWLGAPLLIVNHGGGGAPLALTGSHRIAAARESRIAVPVVDFAELAAAYGIDLPAEIAERREMSGDDGDWPIYWAAMDAAASIPADVLDFYGFDLH